jgi:hypothetical protein
MQTRHLVSVAIAMLGASSSASCFDPVHSDEVDALGPEKRGVREGPNHRPGQNCLTCHGGEGPASAEFAIAGTVYSARGVLEPLSLVSIQLEDANGSKRSTRSNEVGNFLIGKEAWSPKYPLTVKLVDGRADQNGEKAMVTKIGRAGGCAFCHYGNDHEVTHMPPVFLRQKAL